MSDSVLSKQISELESAGLVAATKSFEGKRPRTTLALTKDGLSRWHRHLAALRAIAAWQDRPRWDAIVRRGMAEDPSWGGPAARYLALYERAIALRAAVPA